MSSCLLYKVNIMSKLKEFREHLGYTQTAFAELLGIDKASLSRLEAGKFKPAYETIMALRRIVNLHSGGRKVLLDKILDDF